MQGSILSVHIIDARELRAQNGTGVANARVRLEIEGNPRRTNEVASSNNPVWNEVVPFDIEKGLDTLKVEVQDVLPDRERQIIGTIEIDLRRLSVKQQEWIEAYPGKCLFVS